MTLLRRDYLREIFDGLASHDLEVRHVLVHAYPDELARADPTFASDNRGQPWASSAQLTTSFWSSTAGHGHQPIRSRTDKVT